MMASVADVLTRSPDRTLSVHQEAGVNRRWLKMWLAWAYMRSRSTGVSVDGYRYHHRGLVIRCLAAKIAWARIKWHALDDPFRSDAEFEVLFAGVLARRQYKPRQGGTRCQQDEKR
jgi:hypothetical protein